MCRTLIKLTMTLPSKDKKLNKNEILSIENAVKETGLTAVHPEKMEAFAEELVSRLKKESGDEVSNK